MMGGVIVGIITLVMGLVALWFAFGIRKRTDGELAVSWSFLLFAMVVFSISNIIETLDEAGIISTGQLGRILYALFVVLLVIGFWKMLKCIRKVDGEIEVDGKFKVRKKTWFFIKIKGLLSSNHKAKQGWDRIYNMILQKGK